MPTVVYLWVVHQQEKLCLVMHSGQGGKGTAPVGHLGSAHSSSERGGGEEGGLHGLRLSGSGSVTPHRKEV